MPDPPLRLLAIESSLLTGSVAALADGVLVAERRLDPARRTAQTLAPGIAELLAELGWRPAEVGLVAVAIGPGSFTGLRVAVTTAKTWAYARGVPLVGVGTLAVLAEQAATAALLDKPAVARLHPPAGAPIFAGLDAQRGELFVQEFVTEPNGVLRPIAEPAIVDPATWLPTLAASVTGSTPPPLLTGPFLADHLDDLAGGPLLLAEESTWLPRAATVGQLAWRLFQQGHRDDPFSLLPIYLRPSAAEEKSAKPSQSA